MANKAWQVNIPPQDDPDAYTDEQWAVFSNYPHYHKIIEEISQGLFSTLGFNTLLEYLQKKHNLSMAKLQNTNLTVLQNHLLSLKPHNRATICKLIHNWIPTYSVLCCQGREPSSLCPRCRQKVETNDYIYSCQQGDAVKS
jgi:hypothetical protein